TFDVAGRLQAALGETTAAEEVLVRKLQSLSQTGQIFSAFIKDLQIGKSEAGVDIQTKITREGTVYTVSTTGKRRAHDEPFHRLPGLQFEFDTTKPIFSRDHQDNDATRQKARELLEILNLF
ncbi:MAG: hypothetical protein ACREGF_01240, partial [Candidatus Saccharimonadales bacterium]